MKRLLAYMMCAVLVFSFAGCGKKEASSDASKDAKGDKGNAVELSADNMIVNPDFSDGTTGRWNTYTNGGSATLTNKAGELAVHITNPGKLDYAVQAYYDGFALDSGCEYSFAFDVHSDVDRLGEWRIQINGSDYHAYVSDVVEIKNDVTRIEKTFTMEEGSDPAPRLCLNLGMFEDGPKDLGDHTVFFDNFDLHLVDDSNKVVADDAIETPDINLNQVGYRNDDIKKAVVRGDDLKGKEFRVVDKDGKECFKGTLKDEKKNESSMENVAIADFSDLKESGTYKVVTDDYGESYEFKIGDDVYQELLKDTVKWYYSQRCGCAIEEKYVGEFAHQACHTADATVYGTNEKKEVKGGWHDAGDYGRYVVAGAKAAYDLLDAYENNPDAFGDDWGMVYSGNDIPDILDEVKYELDWLCKMQDDDGGVYHKVTTAAFEDTIMPDEVKDELILSPKSNTASGAFAAVMAKASRLALKGYDANELKEDYYERAVQAVKYTEEHINDAGFKNPEEIDTGEYPDENAVDELFWAYSELYKCAEADIMSIGNDSSIKAKETYEKKLKSVTIASCSGGMGWQSVGFYGALTCLSCDKLDSGLKKDISDYLDYSRKKLVENAKEDMYDSTMGESYYWGSNMGLLNNAMLLIKSAEYDEQDADEFKNIAKEQLNYVLGKNATSYCFVTGYGSLSPCNPHHRPSQVKEKAYKGMIVGGANSNKEDPYAKATMQGVAPAKCYADNVQSYSCNEVTIYWNSPLVYMLSNYVK